MELLRRRKNSTEAKQFDMQNTLLLRKLVYTSFFFFFNKLKIAGPILKIKLFFSFFFFHEHITFSFSLLLFICFSLSLNKIVFFYHLKKKTHLPIKYIIMFFFSYFKICYLKNSTKHIFCMSTLTRKVSFSTSVLYLFSFLHYVENLILPKLTCPFCYYRLRLNFVVGK